MTATIVISCDDGKIVQASHLSELSPRVYRVAAATSRHATRMSRRVVSTASGAKYGTSAASSSRSVAAWQQAAASEQVEETPGRPCRTRSAGAPPR